MKNNIIKALFVNGSPRKNKNTALMLAHAAEGAASKGAQVETIHLYDLSYCGCTSCFACKLKNAKTNGICAVQDALQPILQKAVEADIVVIGTPVYFSDMTGMTRAFIERFVFPNFSYDLDADGNRMPPRIYKQTAMIFTMNIAEQALEQWNYPLLLGTSVKILEQNFGYSEGLYVCNTYQFNDYSRYAVSMFNEADKRKHRDEHFPIDLQRGYELGCRLVENLIK